MTPARTNCNGEANFLSSYDAAIQLDVLKALVESPSCPLAVLRLTAHGILSILSDPRSKLKEPKLREIANRALGLSNDG